MREAVAWLDESFGVDRAEARPETDGSRPLDRGAVRAAWCCSAGRCPRCLPRVSPPGVRGRRAASWRRIWPGAGHSRRSPPRILLRCGADALSSRARGGLPGGAFPCVRGDHLRPGCCGSGDWPSGEPVGAHCLPARFVCSTACRRLAMASSGSSGRWTRYVTSFIPVGSRPLLVAVLPGRHLALLPGRRMADAWPGCGARRLCRVTKLAFVVSLGHRGGARSGPACSSSP